MIRNGDTIELDARKETRAIRVTVSAEELSGLRALECAVDALRRGEVDAALVGAVDLSVEMVNKAAAAHLLDAKRQTPGDAAVVLLLKRADDAQRDNDGILAIVEMENSGPAQEERQSHTDLHLGLADGIPSLDLSYGHAHAATGLLHVAAGVVCLRERVRLTAGAAGLLQPAEPWLAAGARRVHVQIEALGQQSGGLILRTHNGPEHASNHWKPPGLAQGIEPARLAGIEYRVTHAQARGATEHDRSQLEGPVPGDKRVKGVDVIEPGQVPGDTAHEHTVEKQHQ